MKSASVILSLFLFFIIPGLPAAAQEMNEFGFTFWVDLPVETNGEIMENPWAGGLNNVQFGKIDLDGDEIKDLIVFDRHGDRLLPFIFKPGFSPSGYTYAPAYRKYFPPLKHWFQLTDYNRDGRPDIFTYTPGGIMVYKNTTWNTPEFECVVDPYITSLQGSIFTNLLVTYVDYPAITDLDGDGDLDILTFWGLGSYVELHRNMSMELYGSADSLVYHKTDFCWGRFAENPESNLIYLDTCFSGKTAKSALSDPKHTGSTFELIDINGDGVLDLLLGDVDYSDVTALINGGDNYNALMVEQLSAFPVSDPIELWSFPLARQVDIDNTGSPELLVSPFDPSLVKSEGSGSVWLYKNVSVSDIPDFRLQTRSFLQEGMIDLGLGAYPVFTDVNGDGLDDLVTGNYGLYDSCRMNEFGQLKCTYTGRIYLYLNNGTSVSPSFILADDDFGHVSQAGLQGVYPAFDDLDGDGDQDMLIGNSDGAMWLFTNIAGAGNLPVFGAPVRDYQNLRVEAYSTPVFVDINDDGLNDLVVGSVNGRLSWFRNTGSPGEPVFGLVTDFFGKVNVTDPDLSYKGYSVPCFFRKPGGALTLLVGSETGLLKYYTGISADTTKPFILTDPHFMYITEGIRTAPAMSDLNNDNFPDLAIGNYSGGIALLKGTTPGPSGVIQKETVRASDFLIKPNPGKGRFTVEIRREGNWQLSVYSNDGVLIKEFPAEGFREIELSIEKSRSGIVFIKAQNLNKPWLLLNQKVVVIQ